MSVVSCLIETLFKPSFFIKNKALQTKNLYHDVIIQVIKPLASEVNEITKICARQNLTRIGVLYDLVYANLHTGEWHAVPQEDREIFTIVCFVRVSVN